VFFYFPSQVLFVLKNCVCNFVQILDWIRDVGEQYLSSHTTVGNSLEETQALLREHNEFKSSSKVEHWELFSAAFAGIHGGENKVVRVVGYLHSSEKLRLVYPSVGTTCSVSVLANIIVVIKVIYVSYWPFITSFVKVKICWKINVHSFKCADSVSQIISKLICIS